MLEASKLLSAKEIKEFQSKVENTLEYYTKLAKDIDYKEVKQGNVLENYKLKTLENLGHKSRITRLEATRLEIETEFKALATQKEMIIKNHLEDIYEDTYYKTAYIEATETGVGKFINKLDKATINKAVLRDWIGDGNNFSKRIWKNTNALALDLQKNLVVGIATGKSNLAKDLQKKYKVTMAQANRLVQTETSAVRNQATMERYEDSGIEKYKILATLDIKTSSICRSMDQKIFNLKDKEIGINYPPFHINCRTTTIPYLPEFEDGTDTRKAKLADGTEIEVPTSMSYDEWYKKYIKSSTEQLKYEKMDRNRLKDFEEYKNYKSILGVENIAKTFDKYQNMKYNKIEEWESKKREYKTIREIKNKNWDDIFKEKAINTYYEFKSNGIEVSAHFLSRFLNTGRNVLNLTVESILELKEKEIKYKEFILTKNKHNLIRYENIDTRYVRLISNETDKEIISMVFDKNNQENNNLTLGKWEKYEN